MSILTILYGLFIMPLQLVFEEIYFFAYKFCENPGLAIIALSFVVNLLVLPLYDRADAMQIAERDIEAKLRKGVEHIKKTFKGDEQLMMLQTYYRQNNYSPTDIIKGSISLFLEIPFFVAAYQFLSHLEILKGVSLGPIKDLGAPDALLSVFGLTINIMPILMTTINIVSAYIFTKNFPLKTKIQLHGMALFFLVFLYNSPSGLVFYWTLNNLFNLVKTVVYKLDNPKKGAQFALLLCGLVIIVYSLFFLQHPTTKKKLFGIICAFLLNASHITNIIKKMLTREYSFKKIDCERNNSRLFFSCGLFLALLIGAVIPSAVISASPQEFVILQNFQQPIWYVVYTFAVAVGFFIIWFGVFYWLAPKHYRIRFEFIVWAFCGIAIVDYMFFGRSLGILSNELKYENGLILSSQHKMINLLVLLLVYLVLTYLWRKYKSHIVELMMIGSVAFLCMVTINVFTIQQHTNGVELLKASKENRKVFTFSKTGKNVVVIMLDRAMGIYIPYMFNEKPEFKELFAGFTYFPNTVSLGLTTNIGSPGLFGGYEYIPEEMNKRNKELLMDKHNEALRVMPVLFEKNGFNVTVCDLPYANYQWIPDLSIFMDYPKIKTFITAGMYGDRIGKSKLEQANEKIEKNRRNFILFAFTKSVPLYFQKYLYDNGKYNNIMMINTSQEITSLTTANGISSNFMEKYNVLLKMVDMTEIKEKGDNALFFVNDTTHEPAMLQTPEYVPAETIDNTLFEKNNSNRFSLNGKKLRMNNEFQIIHYHANMATMLQIGKWLDFLRSQNVYDNSRIIIVSDHGRELRHSNDFVLHNNTDLEMFYPLLLVKDFNSKEYMSSEEFMTNADVPVLATKGMINNPINPFTGKMLNNTYKKNSNVFVFGSALWKVNKNNGTTFKPGPWYSVEKDVRDKKNWKLVKENALLPY